MFNWYHFLIDLLAVAFIYMMIRHVAVRMLFFLRIFQQKGYKRSEYTGWIAENTSAYVLTLSQILLNVVVILMAFFRDHITSTAATVVIFLLTLFWVGLDQRFRNVRAKKPLSFTPRMTRLAVLTGIFTFAPALWGTWLVFIQDIQLFDIYMLGLVWVLADALAPYWIYPASVILQPVENAVQQGFIRRAKEKLARFPHLKVIAITGSYGKTSTKFILRDLLRLRYNVCATPGSFNTPMGITKVINEDLDAAHDVLILEMGARYPGNIEELCDIATPDVAVVTNVGVAHLETFGSVDVIRTTKKALVDRTRTGGFAILNADDANVRSMSERNDISFYSVGIDNGDLRADSIFYDENGCNFTIVTPDEQRYPVKTRLLGSHNITNILQGVAVGLQMGIRLEAMAVVIAEIEPVEHRLQLKNQGAITVIDDAFNSNPVGAANAVEVLSGFKTGRRVIITPGMVELGALEEEQNRKFGEAIGAAGLDRVVLVGHDRSKPIYEGFVTAGGDTQTVDIVATLFEANAILKDWLQPGDVVLYENDLPDTYNEVATAKAHS